MKNPLLHPILLFAVLLTASINLSSCKKEDPTPTNNVGRIIFWLRQITICPCCVYISTACHAELVEA
jgi:hypothetical protein